MYPSRSFVRFVSKEAPLGLQKRGGILKMSFVFQKTDRQDRQDKTVDKTDKHARNAQVIPSFVSFRESRS